MSGEIDKQLQALALKVQGISLAKQLDREDAARASEQELSFYRAKIEQMGQDHEWEVNALTARVEELERLNAERASETASSTANDQRPGSSFSGIEDEYGHELEGDFSCDVCGRLYCNSLGCRRLKAQYA